jgi:tRNA threonylcarbamoyladenosine biosynthesis protein TsaE
MPAVRGVKPKEKRIVTKSEAETFRLGQKLGRACRGGEVFALDGDLGAGKTKLLQGLANGLGVVGRVNSPTFNILKIYKIKAATVKFFCHIDAYRLKDAADLEALGAEEFLADPETVSAIEWAEKVKKILPRAVKIIKIKTLGKLVREISLR